MRNKSIRNYFFSTITTVLVGSVLIMGIIQTWLATGYFRSEKEQLMRQVVDVVAAGVQSGSIDPASGTLEDIGYMVQVAGALVFITAPNGTVLFSTGEGAPATGVQVAQAVLETVEQNSAFTDMGTLGGVFGRNFYISGRAMAGPTGNTVGYVFAASDASALQVYIIDTISSFVFSAAVVLLMSSFVALVLTNRTVVPIRRLSEAARRFAEGDYSARVPVQGADELATLSLTFNEMANAVEATDISRRSFMGNIAHELRTPMTTIKGFIDGMLDGTIPEPQRDKYLLVVSDEVGRLARLTKNMLDISRLEAGEYSPTNTVFDIWGPITSVILGAERRIEDKQLRYESLGHDEAALVLADEDFVHQVLYNLVDNAIKFADEGGRIALGVTQQKNVVNVTVRNTGTPIPPDTLPHVFDRFYKVDKSRGVNARGAGLGLHISKVLLGLMGGRIWAGSSAEWTEFTFTLPAAPKGRAPRAKRG